MGEEKTRSATEQFKLELMYEHYMAASSYMEARGLDLAQILKDNHTPGRFHRWIKKKDPFNIQFIISAMAQHDFFITDILFKDISTLKFRCLARTIEYIGQQKYQIQAKFYAKEELVILMEFVRVSGKIRNESVGLQINQEDFFMLIFNEIKRINAIAAKQTSSTMRSLLKTWLRHYSECVVELRDFFPIPASELDRFSS